MKRYLLALPAVFFFACNNNGVKEQQTTADTAMAVRSAIPVASTDQEFLTAAAEGSMTEIALGRFASGQASDQRLKDYGYLMIAEHERLLNQVKQMAATQQLKLPDTVDAGHQRVLAYLAGRGGNIFDSTYMAEIIAHQKELSRLYENIKKTTADSNLSRYATTAQPQIIQHMLRLITIKDSINIRKRK